MTYRELLEIAKTYPNCCKGKCPDRKKNKTAGANKTTALANGKQTLLDLVNKLRKETGMEELLVDARLMKTAEMKAKDIVDNNYFSHESPFYGSPLSMIERYGVSFRTAGENIAGNSTVEGALQRWMNSEGHRKNILNKNFRFTGIGIAESPVYGKILVQHFAG